MLICPYFFISNLLRLSTLFTSIVSHLHPFALRGTGGAGSREATVTFNNVEISPEVLLETCQIRIPVLGVGSASECNLDGHFQKSSDFHRPASDNLLQRDSVKNLHHGECLPVRVADVVNRTNVPMIYG